MAKAFRQISRKISEVLELHRAEYGVISQENEGSTFWFELPIAEETKQKAA